MVRKAESSDLEALTALALKLWPGHEKTELVSELADILAKNDAAFFPAEYDGHPGFPSCHGLPGSQPHHLLYQKTVK